MEVFSEQLREFLEAELDQGCRFIVSANDHKAIEYFMQHDYRFTVLPVGQEKEYIKKYAVLLFIATTNPSKGLLDWINNCPMYSSGAPVCIAVAGDCMKFKVNSNTRIYEH